MAGKTCFVILLCLMLRMKRRYLRAVNKESAFLRLVPDNYVSKRVSHINIGRDGLSLCRNG